MWPHLLVLAALLPTPRGGDPSGAAAPAAVRRTAPAAVRRTAPAAVQRTAPPAVQRTAPPFDARAAEHLWNRAGFGATPEQVEASVEAGLDATIERLFAASDDRAAARSLGEPDPPGALIDPARVHERVEARREGFVDLMSDRVSPLGVLGARWTRSMLAGGAPVRDRMTLFWHGHLVSSFLEVGDPHAMVRQVAFLRANALGDLATLLRGIARDPAMLQYLSNAKNRKGHPNENWARELMELFALGDGQYTEDDVKEVARAYTGWTKDEAGFRFDRVEHDFGAKSVLGRTGMLDGDDVVEVLLEQPACARFLAAKLLHWFEGVEPSGPRAEAYAALLRASGYRFEPLLRALFEDPDFYRAEVVGTRVASPLSFVVGASRRLALDAPGERLVAAATVLGQRLFHPPTVKGWEEGRAWVSSGTLMQRGNVAGLLLGTLGVEEVLHDPELGGPPPSSDWIRPPADQNHAQTSGFPMLRFVEHASPGVATALGPALARRHPSRAPDDASLAATALDAWLAVEPAPGTRELAAGVLRSLREAAAIAPADLLDGGADAERVLARFAHAVLAMPEGQLE